MMTTTAQFIEAMRRFPAAVNIVAARAGENCVGFTATAVMSLTAEPPQIAIAVNKSVSGLPALLSIGSFCVSTLSAHHAEIASRFAGKVKGHERFATGEWLTMVTGAPALRDAVLNLDCRVVRAIEFSSHQLVIGQVEAVRGGDGHKPLLYMNGNWASLFSGTDYGSDGYVEAVHRTVGVVGSAERSETSPKERLRQIVQELTLYYIDQQEATRSQLASEDFVPAAQMNDINKLKRSFDDQIVTLLNSGIEQGEFDVEDVQLATFAISGMVAWVHRWYRPGGRLSPEEIGATTARLIDRMISAPTPGG